MLIHLTKGFKNLGSSQDYPWNDINESINTLEKKLRCDADVFLFDFDGKSILYLSREYSKPIDNKKILASDTLAVKNAKAKTEQLLLSASKICRNGYIIQFFKGISGVKY
jgi:hypothetical protein